MTGVQTCALPISALASGARSWVYKSTGLHIHLNRAWFTPLATGKLLVFINSEDPVIRRNIIRLAGRKSCDMAKIKAKKLAPGYSNRDRYEAVNFQHEGTIELRLFKGTLNSNHILADIEFAHALAHYVREVSITDLENWPRFLDWTQKQGSLYREFLEFFNRAEAPTATNGMAAKEG